ncbi:hypothetical protein GCM10027511_38680 [Hymenobacter humi]
MAPAKENLPPPAWISENFAKDRAKATSDARNTTKFKLPTAESYYLFPTWTLGTLQPIAGPVARRWLKYNIIDHQLIERISGDKTNIVNIVNTDNLREFSVGDSARGLRLTYRRYLNVRSTKRALRTAFFEVHYDAGKAALLCQRVAAPNREDVLKYYVKTAQNQLTPVELAPQPVLAALGTEHADALAAYAHQQQLNLTLENDVVRLLAFSDTL